MEIKNIKDKDLNKGEEKFEIKVSNEEIEKKIKEEFEKNKKIIQVPGFRKGKVPYELAIKMYGKEMFLNQAIESLMEKDITEEISKEIEKENNKLLAVVGLDVDEFDMEKIEKNGLTLKVTAAVSYTVDLKGLDKIEVSQKDIDAASMNIKEEVEKQIENDLKQNSSRKKVEDKNYKIKEGDEVELSFKGSIKNEKGEDEYFKGGTSNKYNLVIGSKSFIDGFEDQMIGLKIGDKKDIHVTFPEKYQEESLQGKDAKFEIEVLDIYEIEKPKLDDEFAKDLGHESLKEYKKHIEEHIKKHDEENIKNTKIEKALNYLVEKNKLEVSDEYAKMKANLDFEKTNKQYQMQGLDLKTLMPADELEKIIAESKKQIINELKLNIVVNSLAKSEKEATKKEIEDEIKEYNLAYRTNLTMDEISNNEMYKEFKESLENSVKIKRALDKLVKEIKIVK